MSSNLNIEWTHLRETLYSFAEDVISKARENLADNGSNATYNLSNTLGEDIVIDIDDDHFSVKISIADYAWYIEYGTGPSHVKEGVDDFNVVHLGVQHSGEPTAQYWPPIDAIRNWVSNKPGVPKDDAFAYAVQGKIHKEGIKPKPFLEPAIEFVLPRYEDLITQAIEDDVDEWVNGVLDQTL